MTSPMSHGNGQVQLAFLESTLTGNPVSRDKTLPPGLNLLYLERTAQKLLAVVSAFKRGYLVITENR